MTFRGALSWGVFVVWASNLTVLPVLVDGYKPSIAANAPLMLVLGVALRPRKDDQ